MNARQKQTLAKLQTLLDDGLYIYPVLPGLKHPYGGDDAPKYWDASNDPQVVEGWVKKYLYAWWSMNPELSNMVALDGDQHPGKPNTRKELERLFDDFGWPKTRMEETAGNGLRVFHRVPEHPKFRTGKIKGTDVEVIVNHKPLVIWPSEGYTRINDAPIAPAEGWLLSRLPVVREHGEGGDGLEEDPPTLEELRKNLGRLSPDRADDRETWIAVGQAIHNVYPGADGLGLWEEWSAQSPKFKPGECAKLWKGFTQGRGRKTTAIGAMVKEDYKIPGRHLTSEDFKRIAETAATTPTTPIQRMAWLTGFGNADGFVRQYGHLIRFVPSYGWVAWDGRRWKKNEDKRGNVAQVKLFADLSVRELYTIAAEAPDRADSAEIANWAKRSMTNNSVEAIISLAKSHVMASTDDFDNHPNLLNVQNGTLNLDTGELLPHDPAHMITKLADVEFDPDADCPFWKESMDMSFKGDEEMIAFVQKCYGYSISGYTSAKALFFHHGPSGDNGKSAYFLGVRVLLGDYAMVIPIGELMSVRNFGPSQVTPFLANLQNMRFVITTEVPKGMKWDTETVKTLTGNDPISANPKHKTSFDFLPTHKVHAMGNPRPEVDDGGDDAFWNRMVKIDYDVKIPEDKQLPAEEVQARFAAEGPGILNWLLEGYRAFSADRRFKIRPKAVKESVESYRVDEDPVMRFIAEEFTLMPGVKSPRTLVYKAFQTWLLENGEDRHYTAKGFTEALEKIGIHRSADRRAYVGIVGRADEFGEKEGG